MASQAHYGQASGHGDPAPRSGALERVVRVLDTLEAGVIAVLSLAAIALIVFESVLRYVAPTHLSDWNAEVSVYLVGWALMLALPQLVSSQRHVRADFLLYRLPPAARQALDALALLAGLAFCVVVLKTGIEVVGFSHMLGERSDSSLQFPMWLFFLAIPVGYGLSAFRYLLCLCSMLQSWLGALRRGSCN